MQKIIVGAMVPMDGVMQAPGGPSEVRSPPRPQDLRDFRRVLAVLRRKSAPRQHRETVQRDQEVRGFALGRGRYELAGLGAPRDIADTMALCNHQERSNDPHHHRF